MPKFTVIAIYRDNMQRLCGHGKAKNPEAAQKKFVKRMRKKGHEVLVAGVLQGHLCPVDQEENACWPGNPKNKHV